MAAARFEIKTLPPEIAERFRRGAAFRGLTQAEYLERLLDLHDRMRALAALGLQTVSG